MKKLFRSRKNRILSGVCGGIGEYFEIDPVLIRLLTLILTFITPWTLVVYIIAWIITPKEIVVPTN